jgi:hypothetical protein
MKFESSSLFGALLKTRRAGVVTDEAAAPAQAQDTAEGSSSPSKAQRHALTEKPTLKTERPTSQCTREKPVRVIPVARKWQVWFVCSDSKGELEGGLNRIGR